LYTTPKKRVAGRHEEQQKEFDDDEGKGLFNFLGLSLPHLKRKETRQKPRIFEERSFPRALTSENCV
jgi:hypothetical protein